MDRLKDVKIIVSCCKSVLYGKVDRLLQTFQEYNEKVCMLIDKLSTQAKNTHYKSFLIYTWKLPILPIHIELNAFKLASYGDR